MPSRSVPCPAGAQGALPHPPAAAGAAAAAGSAMAEPSGAPAAFGRPAPLPQTGWERLSELWRRDEQQQYPEETLNIAKSAFTAGVVGWLYGGLPAFISARKAFIESSRGEIFQNRADAVQSAHRAGVRSFIRYGWRWSWRVAVFATIFNVVSTGLSAYRDKTTISNFAAAGAFTGALFRMHLGLQGLAGGIVFGTAFGVPAGGLLLAVYGLAGETLQEKRSRERKELYEQRLAEWQSRLRMTEILGQTENNAQGRPEMERTTELKSY